MHLRRVVVAKITWLRGWLEQLHKWIMKGWLKQGHTISAHVESATHNSDNVLNG